MGYTNEISLRQFYEKYVEIAKRKNREYLPYNKYAKLLRLINEKCRERIVYRSEIIDLPYSLGELFIKKFENSFNLEKQYRWAVDYKHYKDTGEIKYFGSRYGYRWKWAKNKCKTKGKKWYRFTPCRRAKRMVADAIKNKGQDYYN